MIKVIKIVQYFFFQYLKPNDAKNLVDCFVSCKRKTKSNKIIDSKDVALKVRKFQKHIFLPSILLKHERKKWLNSGRSPKFGQIKRLKIMSHLF